MSDADDIGSDHGSALRGKARWLLCFGAAIAFHGAGAAALISHFDEDSDLVANAPVVMIDLAPVPVAQETVPNDMPPDQQMAKEQEEVVEPEPPKPVEKIELPPPQVQKQAELTIPPPRPPEKKVEKKKEPKKKSAASAPSAAENQAERPTAPLPGASSHNNDALPNWKSQLVARLERYKRYPSDAQSRGEQGVTHLAFSVDRGGGVHNARIVRSSGSSALDQATLSLIERASPLPPPPPEMGGTQIAIVVPIRYNVR